MISKSFFAKITGIKNGDDTEIGVKPALETEEHDQKVAATKFGESQKGEVEATDWVQQNYEGQLSVDVYQTEDEIVIKSAVAGVNPEDLDISISNDMITIRGARKQEEEVSRENYFYQECYWGSFSRSIILPQEIQAELASADFKRGILTIRLPKARQLQKIQVRVSEQDS